MSEVTYSFTAAYKCCKVNIERRPKFTTTMHSVEHTSANDQAADYLNSITCQAQNYLNTMTCQHSGQSE